MYTLHKIEHQQAHQPVDGHEEYCVCTREQIITLFISVLGVVSTIKQIYNDVGLFHCLSIYQLF